MVINSVKASKIGGAPDDAFFDSLDDAIGNLAGDFVAWVRSDLDAGLAALNAETDDADARLVAAKKIFTIMHDLKGQAGTFGYFLLSEIAESACEYCRNFVVPPTGEQAEILRLHIMAARFVIDREIKKDAQVWEKFCVKRDALIALADGATPAS
jgi:hypothetical protein